MENAKFGTSSSTGDVSQQSLVRIGRGVNLVHESALFQHYLSSEAIMKDVKQPIADESALRLLLFLGCSIFVAEALSHLLTHALPPISQWGIGLLDSTLHLALVLPIIYFFVYRPSIAHIAERKTADAKIQRQRQLYAALSQCNQAILRCTNEEVLFSQICRDAVQFGGMKMAWIGLTDPDTRMVRPVACFGKGVEYLQGIEISVDADSPFGHGPVSTAIREGRPFWCQDFMNDPLTTPWQERGARAGWLASASLPLHRNGIAIGAFILYAGEANAFDEAARDLLVEMAMDISFALDNFTHETARKLAEANLRIAATAFEAQEGMVVTDADNVILRVNQAFTRLTGYSAEEAIGQKTSLLASGRHDKQFYRDMWEALNRDHYWCGEIWNRRKNGEVHPEWLTITTVPNDEGQVTNYVSAFFDISQHKKDEAKIHSLVFYDQLTGLPNRRLIRDRLQHSFTASARHHNHGAVLFIDLDNLKTLNNTKGHSIGDLLLIDAAKRMQASVREGDTAARLGGDEFIVLAEDLGVARSEAARQAGLVAEKIREALNRPYSLNGYEYSISPSIGVCLFKGNEEEVEELIQHADLAMYQAKNSGRNKVCFCESEPPA